MKDKHKKTRILFKSNTHKIGSKMYRTKKELEETPVQDRLIDEKNNTIK